MWSPSGDEQAPVLEAMTQQGLRRRRRSVFDVQSARCPRCGQPLVVYQAVGGPAYHCGCGQALALGGVQRPGERGV